MYRFNNRGQLDYGSAGYHDDNAGVDDYGGTTNNGGAIDNGGTANNGGTR